jgi:hypothetical protein
MMNNGLSSVEDYVFEVFFRGLGDSEKCAAHSFFLLAI